jgi:hypothetical protein
MRQSLRDSQRDRTRDFELRSNELRANALFKVASVIQGGERHLLQVGDGVVTSQRFGGAVGVGDTVLMRNDSGESFFY